MKTFDQLFAELTDRQQQRPEHPGVDHRIGWDLGEQVARVQADHQDQRERELCANARYDSGDGLMRES